MVRTETPGYNPDHPLPLSDPEAEALLILLHRWAQADNSGIFDLRTTVGDAVEDLAMSMDPTTDLADRIRQDLGA